MWLESTEIHFKTIEQYCGIKQWSYVMIIKETTFTWNGLNQIVKVPHLHQWGIRAKPLCLLQIKKDISIRLKFNYKQNKQCGIKEKGMDWILSSPGCRFMQVTVTTRCEFPIRCNVHSSGHVTNMSMLTRRISVNSHNNFRFQRKHGMNPGGHNWVLIHCWNHKCSWGSVFKCV